MTVLNQFKQLDLQNYINIETYRRTGEGIKTSVWFIEDQGSLFVRTQADSGKVMRIRRNSRIRLAPCDAGGKISGQWMDANALIINDQSQVNLVENKMNKKYGFLKRLFDLRQKWQKTEMATIEIRIVPLEIVD